MEHTDNRTRINGIQVLELSLVLKPHEAAYKNKSQLTNRVKLWELRVCELYEQLLGTRCTQDTQLQPAGF